MWFPTKPTTHTPFIPTGTTETTGPTSFIHNLTTETTVYVHNETTEITTDFITQSTTGHPHHGGGGPNVGLIVGLTVGLLLLLLLVVLLYVFRRSILNTRVTVTCHCGACCGVSQWCYGMCCGPCRACCGTVNSRLSSRNKRPVYQANQKLYGTGEIDQQFNLLVRSTPNFPKTIALRRENAQKNRYVDVVPYDHNIVTLLSGSYINASHIEPDFIATQDPMTAQDEHFWPMIWECGVSVIVRLSSDAVLNQTPCAVYLPPKKWVLGSLEISMVGEEYHGDGYTRRILRLSDTETRFTHTRDVHHYQLTCWPTDATPDVRRFLSVVRDIRRAKRSMASSNGPRTLVHCGAGAGRTGTFIATWQLMDKVDSGQPAVVREVVRSLREQRPHMVNKKELFHFVYKCISTYQHQMGTSSITDDYEMRDARNTSQRRF